MRRTEGVWIESCGSMSIESCWRKAARKARGIVGATGESGEGRQCAICQVVMVGGRTLQSANLDHDHRTGKIRGFICGSCNKILGYAKDDIDILIGCIRYLNRHHGRAVRKRWI